MDCMVRYVKSVNQSRPLLSKVVRLTQRQSGHNSMNSIPSWFLPHLCCPDCNSRRNSFATRLHCETCGYVGKDLLTQINLQPKNPRPFKASFTNLSLLPESSLLEIDLSPPLPSYEGPMPGRNSSELMSEIISLQVKSGAVLDLGCGPRDQAECFAYLGLDYVGLDLPGSNADIIGDAHFPPFHAASFEVIFSYAVFEHLYNPFLAMLQVERILKPGGVFVGVVSQGEPFHSSYFHQTPWGLQSLCDVAGLKLTRIWSGPDTLTSIAAMGRYPRMIRGLIKVTDELNRRLPVLAPRRMAWKDREKSLDQLYRAGSLCFSITKPIV
jgi:SAM-dependent methyltransferase